MDDMILINVGFPILGGGFIRGFTRFTSCDPQFVRYVSILCFKVNDSDCT